MTVAQINKSKKRVKLGNDCIQLYSNFYVHKKHFQTDNNTENNLISLLRQHQFRLGVFSEACWQVGGTAQSGTAMVV